MKQIGPITTTLAAGVTNRNILTGEVHQQLENDAEVTVLCSVPAAAANTCTVSFSIGSEIVTDSAIVGIEETAGFGPDVRRHLIGKAFGMASDQLRISAVDSGGTTLKTIVLIDDES